MVPSGSPGRFWQASKQANKDCGEISALKPFRTRIFLCRDCVETIGGYPVARDPDHRGTRNAPEEQVRTRERGGPPVTRAVEQSQDKEALDLIRKTSSGCFHLVRVLGPFA